MHFTRAGQSNELSLTLPNLIYPSKICLQNVAISSRYVCAGICLSSPQCSAFYHKKAGHECSLLTSASLHIRGDLGKEIVYNRRGFQPGLSLLLRQLHCVATQLKMRRQQGLLMHFSATNLSSGSVRLPRYLPNSTSLHVFFVWCLERVVVCMIIRKDQLNLKRGIFLPILRSPFQLSLFNPF